MSSPSLRARSGAGFPTLAALAGLLALAGCGGSAKPSEQPPDPQRESRDRAAKAPPGWRVVRNREAGLTVSAPRTWPARVRGPATLIRSQDRLLALSLSADRSEGARTLSPRLYARRTLRSLPGFKNATPVAVGLAAGSRYSSYQWQARAGRRRARVASFQKPGRVTYTAVAFTNSRVAPRANDRALKRVLASLRAGPPAL